MLATSLCPDASHVRARSYAKSIEHDAPGLVALVAVISSLLALVLLLMAAVVCVRLRRLQAQYAQLTSAAAREGGAQPKDTEQLDDGLEMEMTTTTTMEMTPPADNAPVQFY